jgi:hypothetical protein
VGDEQLAHPSDHGGVATGGELGVGQRLVGVEQHLLDAGRGVAGEGVVDQAGERLTPHRPHRLAEQRDRPAVVALGLGRAAVADQALQPGDVDVVGRHPERVTGGVPADLVTADDATKVRDLGLESVGGLRRLVVAPQLLEQAVVGDGVRRRQGEHGQERLQLGARHRHRAGAGVDLDRPEQRHAHLRSSHVHPPRTGRYCVPGPTSTAGALTCRSARRQSDISPDREGGSRRSNPPHLIPGDPP